MMDRFNFYDVYGYLIPGFVGLLAAALPFFLVFQLGTISVSELTFTLIISYVAGHAISGIARLILPTERHVIEGEEHPVALSVWWLSPGFSGKNPPSKAFKKTLTTLSKKRFGFEPTAKALFFMCRTVLIQAKLASYVEQYQGMESLMRSLAAIARLAPVYYAAWVTASALANMFRFPDVRPALPLLTLAIGIMVADFVSGILDRDAEAKGDEVMAFDLRRPECRVVIGVLLVAGAVGGLWYPLQSRDGHQLAISAGLISLLALRFKSAFLAFEQSLARGVFYDFVALESMPRAEFYPKPDDD